MNRPHRLGDAALAQALSDNPHWSSHGAAPATMIVREVVLPSFPAAIAFVTEVGFAAEALNHHPDIFIRWCTVRLTLSTHDAGGLTALDFQLAKMIDAIVSASRVASPVSGVAP